MFRRYPTKYNSRKIEIDGHKFPSKLEAKRYLELKQLLEEGKIRDLELQKEFILIPSFRKNGRTYRKTSYFADFCYFDKREGKYIVEDTKGFKTEVYRLKKKLFEQRYEKLTITEVKR